MIEKKNGVAITLASIFVFMVVSTLSFVVSNFMISSSVKEADYYQIMRVANNKSDFDYLLKTNAGRTGIDNAEVKTLDPVTITGLTKQYSYVKSEREEYTEHSVTTTDSKGNTTTTYYWSWDYTDSKKASSKYITINGIKTKTNSFDNPTQKLKLSKKNTDLHHIDGWFGGSDPWISSKGNYLYTDSDTRYSFTYTPLKYKTTIFAKLSDNKVQPLSKSGLIETYNKSVKKVKQQKNDHSKKLMVWQLPIVLGLGVLATLGFLLFVYYEF